MNKLKTAVCLGLCLGVGMLGLSPARAAGNVKFYIAAEGVYSFSTLTAGGYNTQGGFNNKDSAADNVFRGGAHLGLEVGGVFSLDFGFHYRGGLAYTTDSYVDMFEHYYYETEFDAYGLMFSVFVSPFPDYALSPYIGAGIGAAMTKMTTDDTVVEGSIEQTNMAWQLEAGLELQPTNHFGLKVGYRYLNMGTDDAPLRAGISDSGNFTGAVKAHEITAGLRIKF
ncbi:MAG: porin family protein [Candidatus Aminicenantes bacterium]|nr:porin family protein [Candidatus Aminicenantes bacterium]